MRKKFERKEKSFNLIENGMVGDLSKEQLEEMRKIIISIIPGYPISLKSGFDYSKLEMASGENISREECDEYIQEKLKEIHKSR